MGCVAQEKPHDRSAAKMEIDALINDLEHQFRSDPRSTQVQNDVAETNGMEIFCEVLERATAPGSKLDFDHQNGFMTLLDNVGRFGYVNEVKFSWHDDQLVFDDDFVQETWEKISNLFRIVKTEAEINYVSKNGVDDDGDRIDGYFLLETYQKGEQWKDILDLPEGSGDDDEKSGSRKSQLFDMEDLKSQYATDGVDTTDSLRPTCRLTVPIVFLIFAPALQLLAQKEGVLEHVIVQRIFK